jgi:hypothetical protein
LNSLPLLLFFFSTKFLQKTLELLLLLLLLLFGHFVLRINPNALHQKCIQASTLMLL